jgi:hypothetical protein
MPVTVSNPDISAVDNPIGDPVSNPGNSVGQPDQQLSE